MEPLITLTLQSGQDKTTRIGVVQKAFSDDSVLFEARDGNKPALLTLKPEEFPWFDYIQALLTRWELSRPVPPCFRPLRRLPAEVLEALRTLPTTDALRIMQGLRTAQFLPALEKKPSSVRSVENNLATAAAPHPKQPIPRKKKISGPDWG